VILWTVPNIRCAARERVRAIFSRYALQGGPVPALCWRRRLRPPPLQGVATPRAVYRGRHASRTLASGRPMGSERGGLLGMVLAQFPPPGVNVGPGHRPATGWGGHVPEQAARLAPCRPRRGPLGRRLGGKTPWLGRAPRYHGRGDGGMNASVAHPQSGGRARAARKHKEDGMPHTWRRAIGILSLGLVLGSSPS
jgi:hypothetical protein